MSVDVSSSVQAEIEALLRHADCMERAAADPDATPRIAAGLRAVAANARTAAHLAGIPATPTPVDHQETRHAP